MKQDVAEMMKNKQQPKQESRGNETVQWNDVKHNVTRPHQLLLRHKIKNKFYIETYVSRNTELNWTELNQHNHWSMWKVRRPFARGAIAGLGHWKPLKAIV